MYQCSKHGWVSKFEDCPKCVTPIASAATTNTNCVVETLTPTPDKKLTPMGELIDRIKPLIGKYGIEADAMITTAIAEASSLLEAEREMVEMSFTDGDMNRTYVDPADYFTQNYRQQ